MASAPANRRAAWMESCRLDRRTRQRTPRKRAGHRLGGVYAVVDKRDKLAPAAALAARSSPAWPTSTTIASGVPAVVSQPEAARNRLAGAANTRLPRVSDSPSLFAKPSPPLQRNEPGRGGPAMAIQRALLVGGANGGWVGKTRAVWGFGQRRVGGGSPDDVRWDLRKKEREVAGGGGRSPERGDLPEVRKKKREWGFGQHRVGGGSPDDDRWDLRKRRREEERNRNGCGSPDLREKTEEEEAKKADDDVEEADDVEGEEEEDDVSGWYGGPGFECAAPDPGSLPIPTFILRQAPGCVGR
uniref:Uncharacterized protein n=1 Tax=Leersia perrieri TaxID=77586 RepID=A0A0D9VEI9_9ORYZ